MAEEKKRPNGPQWGEFGTVRGLSPIQELRDVEDVVMLMSPGKARNVLLADLRRLRDDVVDELVVTE